ncbi:hypothetical protein [Thioalkalivibrio sp.]|uniref:hypothetical protein n=1 Tax=Thioalkalivibrio sp. TaxID=2093813 RepID=UPI003976F76D
MPPNNIIEGPKVATWNCPSCREAVPRLLPNGQRNRVRLRTADMLLPATEIRAAAEHIPGPRAGEVCFACAQAYRELLGTLIRPPGEEGDARGGPGLNDTGIVGALLPIAGRGTQVLVFHVVAGALSNTEIEDLRQLHADRLTYPGTRGSVAPLLWSLYDEHLAQLHATAPLGEPDPHS